MRVTSDSRNLSPSNRLLARLPRKNYRQPVQGAVDDEGASTLPKQEEGAEVVRQPSPAAAVAGEVCEPASIRGEAGVEHVPSGTEPTTGAGIGGEVDGHGDQQRQAGDEEGRQAVGSQPSASTPSSNVTVGEADGQGGHQRQARDEEERHEVGSQPSGSAPSPKVQVLRA